MRDADECIAKAAALSSAADLATAPNIRDDLLLMAELWLDISRMAELQEAQPLSTTYRIRGH